MRQVLSIGAFSLPAPWLGASHVVGIYTIPVTSAFTFKYTKRLSLDVSYSLVLRSIVGSTVTRAVLWRSTASMVPFPDYVGEAFPAGSVIEVWSAQGYDPCEADGIELELGILELPDTCCDTTPTSYSSTGCIIGDSIPDSVDGLFANCEPTQSNPSSVYEFSSTETDFSSSVTFDSA